MVIWTDNAILNITDFIDNSKSDENTAKEYMEKLIDYTEILETMPRIGKEMDNIRTKYELRQMIYKNHRIIYHIKEDEIVIIAILHTRLDLDSAIKRLKRNFN